MTDSRKVEDAVSVPRGALQSVIDNLFAEHDGEWDSITTPDDVVAICAALATPSPSPVGVDATAIERGAELVRAYRTSRAAIQGRMANQDVIEEDRLLATRILECASSPQSQRRGACILC